MIQTQLDLTPGAEKVLRPRTAQAPLDQDVRIFYQHPAHDSFPGRARLTITTLDGHLRGVVPAGQLPASTLDAKTYLAARLSPRLRTSQYDRWLLRLKGYSYNSRPVYKLVTMDEQHAWKLLSELG